jgi:hypothetical protein
VEKVPQGKGGVGAPRIEKGSRPSFSTPHAPSIATHQCARLRRWVEAPSRPSLIQSGHENHRRDCPPVHRTRRTRRRNDGLPPALGLAGATGREPAAPRRPGEPPERFRSAHKGHHGSPDGGASHPRILKTGAHLLKDGWGKAKEEWRPGQRERPHPLPQGIRPLQYEPLLQSRTVSSTLGQKIYRSTARSNEKAVRSSNYTKPNTMVSASSRSAFNSASVGAGPASPPAGGKLFKRLSIRSASSCSALRLIPKSPILAIHTPNRGTTSVFG